MRGLDFNLHSRNLFASGATNGEVRPLLLCPRLLTRRQIYVWDLTTPNKPYSPGARSRSIDDITSLAWNSHVSHILATGSDSGYTVVWDLKSKREVTALSYTAAGATGVGNGFGQPGWGGGGKRGVSCVQWHPDNVRPPVSCHRLTRCLADQAGHGLRRRPKPHHHALGSAQLEGAREGACALHGHCR